jgi:nucleoporin NUP42
MFTLQAFFYYSNDQI